MFRKFFSRNSDIDAVHDLYGCIITQARKKEFYQDFAVPDTLDGRFDMVTLHMFLVLHRLRQDKKTTEEFSQKLFDLMFSDMDLSLREMGVGDDGVGKRVKSMLQGFYGRLAAYEKALEDGDQALEEALTRNLYGTVSINKETCVKMCEYLHIQIAFLGHQDTSELMSGKVTFSS